MEPDVARVLAGLPPDLGLTGAPERLGGLTNRVYRIGGAVLRP